MSLSCNAEPYTPVYAEEAFLFPVTFNARPLYIVLSLLDGLSINIEYVIINDTSSFAAPNPLSVILSPLPFAVGVESLNCSMSKTSPLLKVGEAAASTSITAIEKLSVFCASNSPSVCAIVTSPLALIVLIVCLLTLILSHECSLMKSLGNAYKLTV